MANDDVLRLRATVVSEEALANIRAIGREIGLVPQKARPAIVQTNTLFAQLTTTVKNLGSEVSRMVPSLGGFGIGAAGAGLAAAALIKTLTSVSSKIVELRYASKELGMSERDLRAWSLAAEKAGIAPQAMMSGLKNFKTTTEEFKYNIGGVRDELIALGAGPVVQRIMAATTQTNKLKEAFDFKEALMRADPSGFKARKFTEMIGLGADAARLSWEEFSAAMAKTKPLSKEDEERAKKFHDGMIELGNAWDQLVTKTAIQLFPSLTTTIKTLDSLLDKLNAIDTAWDKFARGPSGKGTLLGKIVPGYDYQPNLNPRVGGGRTAPPAAATPDVPAGDAFKNFMHPRNVNPRVGGYKPTSFGDGFGGGGGGGEMSEFSKAVKVGVFEALVEFKSFVEGGGGTAGAGGFSPASFGGSAGAAAGGGVGGRGGGAAAFGGAGYTNLTPGTGGGSAGGESSASAGGGRRGLAHALRIDRGTSRRGGGGGDAGPGSDGSTAPPSGNLAAQRAGFQKELDADPQLKNYAIDAMQHEGGIQSNMEQLFNMAAMRHMTIRQALHSGQYGPVKRGLISGNISAKTAATGEAALKKVYAGSNITDYATDQGMAGDPNFAKYMANREHFGMHKVEGAWFSAHGEPGVRWAQQQRARDAAAATPRIDQAINTSAAGGQNVTGNVNLTVNSNGTSAKTKADADGLWQKTTIQNYKQMQPTEKPASFADRFAGAN